MKIAVNTRLLLPNKLEGMGWFMYETLKRMVETHPEDEFIFFFDRPFDEQFIFGKNVTPVILFPPARHPFLFVWWFEWSVARALKKYQPDAFLSPDNFLTLNTKVPTVLVTHDIAHHHFPEQVSFLVRKYYSFFIPKFLKKADRVVTVSKYTKQDIVQTYGIDENKITVACNGCREMFKPLNNLEKENIKQKYSEGEDYFFYVGAIHPRKNVPRLIQAFDVFKKRTGSDAKLLLAGRMAWQTGEVSKVLQQIDCQYDVNFLGYLSDKELPLLTGAALASTYVSLFEGFGIPILEAMQCEVPVITSNVSSMPEVAKDAAILVNPKSIEEISEAMEYILYNGSARKGLIEKGKKQLKKFTWEKAAIIIYNNLKKLETKEQRKNTH